MMSFPSLSNWILSIYAICGGLLICCLETQLKFIRTSIAINFGFLFSPNIRFLYYILLCMISWGFENIAGRAVALALGFIAVFNTYILCRYPGYREVREQIAKEEDRRIEEKINGDVQK
mmetsp:Transcript_37479/g.37827  ORF Transcript_37479/g.37827 Transcript_37479/m.37827 type:complete len:119 (-) Transcript_37479:551-907(-)